MKIIITIEDELSKNGERKTEVQDDKTIEITSSMYAREFDNACRQWTRDPEYNLMYLQNLQRYASDRLRTKGHIFLNEVYDMLGMRRTKAGAVVGWVFDKENPIGDNFVDFGLKAECNSDFMNGYTADALLDFNVDGCILDRI